MTLRFLNISIFWIQLICMPFAFAGIPTGDAASAVGSAGSAGQSGADLKKQMQLCKQKMMKIPPQPCTKEKQKMKQDSAQTAASLAQVLASLASLASALGNKGGGGGYSQAFDSPSFDYDNPQKIGEALNGIGATPREIRKMLDAKEALDEFNKSEFSKNDDGPNTPAVPAPSNADLKEAETEMKEIKERVEKSLSENFPSLNSELGVGGGAAGGPNSSNPENEELQLASLEPFKIDLPSSSLEDNISGELNTSATDLFEKLSRRYQIKLNKGDFISGSDGI